MLTEAQLAALERAKQEKEAHGEFESECPGYCGAQDTLYVGTMRGVGRIYQQTFVDTCDRVLPFFEEHGIKLCRVLTDRGTEFCGNPERHEYELYLAVENVDHSRTKTRSTRRGRSARRPPWIT